MTIFDALNDVLMAPGFLQIAGIMVWMSILLGGGLAWDFGDMKRWLAAFLPYLLFFEWARQTVILYVGLPYTLRPLLIALTTATIWTVGLVVGGSVVSWNRGHFGRKRQIIMDAAARARRSYNHEPT